MNGPVKQPGGVGYTIFIIVMLIIALVLSIYVASNT